MSGETHRSGPLAGVRVVELAGLAPAPFGAMMLADMGADVVRVCRGDGGFSLVPPDGPLDRGKSAVTLDLRNERDRELLYALTDRADVFIEGFRPGVAEGRGVGPEDLTARNPRLIYARLTGWGQSGPLAPRAGHDINYIAVSGALGLVGPKGQAPTPPANMLADFAGGGMLMATGILAALYERGSSGKGQVLDVAMVDGAALLSTFMHGMHAAGMWNAPRGANFLDGGAPFYDTYECADGEYVAVGCIEPKFFQCMVDGLEQGDAGESAGPGAPAGPAPGAAAEAEGDANAGPRQDPLPSQLDLEAWPELRERLAERFRQKTRDEWVAIFEGTDACVSPILSPWEAAEHPHNKGRGAFVQVGGVLQPAPAPRFGRTPLPTPAPQVDSQEGVARALQPWGLEEDVREALAATRK